ncbi:hypothetical protein GCM10023194_58530 [Planotetraspora phitsanulokensis]
MSADLEDLALQLLSRQVGVEGDLRHEGVDHPDGEQVEARRDTLGESVQSTHVDPAAILTGPSMIR